MTFALDVTDRSAVEDAFSNIDREIGPVSILVNNALVESDEGRQWLPEFAELSKGEWVPADEGAELVYRLARGDADGLSGRAVHVMNDLDDLIAQANAISAGDRLALRILP